MKCPYQDLGCYYINDVNHECEAGDDSRCRHHHEDDGAVPARGYAYSRNRQEDDEE